MSEAYVGEIRLFAFGFAPKGWLPCDGTILPIVQSQALFSILGATYGGNGQTTFALPDLRGRAPVHFNRSLPLGESAGEEAHTLTVNEMPTHAHMAGANSDAAGTVLTTTNNVWGNAEVANYSPNNANLMSPNALSMAGSGQPHSNMQPYTVLNYCIATTGVFPSKY